jgi:hypothetical protein
MQSRKDISLASEKLKVSRCKYCKQPIEWARSLDGRWIALEGNLMGPHRCIGSGVPRFEIDKEDLDIDED